MRTCERPPSPQRRIWREGGRDVAQRRSASAERSLLLLVSTKNLSSLDSPLSIRTFGASSPESPASGSSRINRGPVFGSRRPVNNRRILYQSHGQRYTRSGEGSVFLTSSV